MKIRKDITGKTFGYLTAIRPEYKVGGRTYWLCSCKCGKTKAVIVSKLLNRETRSCGCYQREVAKTLLTSHGLEGHPLLRKWREMKKRCYNPQIKNYSDYGGRGVKVCDEWLNDFMAFYNWSNENGYKAGMQLDKDIIARKLNVEPLLYSPERCQYVTCKENNNNRRTNRYIEHEGVTKTLHQWSEIFNINHGTLFGRLKMGWSFKDAITISTIKTGKQKCFH